MYENNGAMPVRNDTPDNDTQTWQVSPDILSLARPLLRYFIHCFFIQCFFPYKINRFYKLNVNILTIRCFQTDKGFISIYWRNSVSIIGTLKSSCFQIYYIAFTFVLSTVLEHYNINEQLHINCETRKFNTYVIGKLF